jgi:excisionase family DNA binding protein
LRVAVERALITPEETAQMLSISRSLVYLLVKEGELPAVHVRRAVRLPVAGVREWIERRLADEGERR